MWIRTLWSCTFATYLFYFILLYIVNYKININPEMIMPLVTPQNLSFVNLFFVILKMSSFFVQCLDFYKSFQAGRYKAHICIIHMYFSSLSVDVNNVIVVFRIFVKPENTNQACECGHFIFKVVYIPVFYSNIDHFQTDATIYIKQCKAINLWKFDIWTIKNGCICILWLDVMHKMSTQCVI